MASSYYGKIVIEICPQATSSQVSTSYVQLREDVFAESDVDVLNKLRKLLRKIAGGNYNTSLLKVVTTDNQGTQASSALTVATGGITNGETVTVGDVVLTAKTTPDPMAKDQFAASSTVNTVAASFKNCVNNHPVLRSLVVASGTTAVITCTALVDGSLSNNIATTDAAATASWSSATLASGAEGTNPKVKSFIL